MSIAFDEQAVEYRRLLQAGLPLPESSRPRLHRSIKTSGQGELRELDGPTIERLWRAYRQGVEICHLADRFGVHDGIVKRLLRERRALAESRGEPTGTMTAGSVVSRCRITGVIL